MPLIGFHPASEGIERELDNIFAIIRARIKAVVEERTGFPPHDIIVTLHKCTVRNADPSSSAIVVLLETNPNETIEKGSDELRNAIGQVLIDLGVTQGRNVEIWTRFIRGSWLLIFDGNIQDMVDYE